MAAFDIKKLLQSVVTHGASDLHLVSRTEPQIRLDGALKPVNLPKLTGDDIEEMCYSLITEKQKQHFEEHNELDFALLLPGIGRFRANYYKTLGEMAAAFRIIPIEVPSLDDLGAPEVFKKLIKRSIGLEGLSVAYHHQFALGTCYGDIESAGIGDKTDRFGDVAAYQRDEDYLFLSAPVLCLPHFLSSP